MLLLQRQQHSGWVMSRSSMWRILEEADIKPHRSVYWLNSHDPAFDGKAQDICQLYGNALRFYEEGRLVICVDEKTGMQILQRKYPTQLVQAGKPEKREHEYIRHGVRVLLASFVVPTGQVLWNLGGRGPARISRRIWPTWSGSSQTWPAMTGCSTTGIRTGAWRCVSWWLGGAIDLLSPRCCNAGSNGGHS